MRRRIMCLICAASVLFTGCQNKEGKVYTTVSQSGAKYETDEYILIEKQDLTKMDDKDADAISQMGGVDRVELYGTANRIHYYCNLGTDYEEREEGILEIKDTGKTMRSAENLTAKDISEGQLPKEMDEIVLYSSDESLLGAKLKICLYDCEYMGEPAKNQDFSNNYWRGSELTRFSYGGYCLEQEFTVTGLLKEKSTQIYFSENFCTMISRAYAGNLYSDSHMVRFNGTKEKGLEDLPGELSLTGDTRLGVNRQVHDSLVYGELDWNKQAQYRLYPANEVIPCLYVYQEGCGDNEVQISERLVQYNIDFSVGKQVSLYRILLLAYMLPEGTVYEGEEWMEDEFGSFGLTNVQVEKRPECTTIMEISDKTHSSGAYVVGVGQKMFDRIYGTDGSYEMAVFPAEGTDVQELEEKLSEAGYQIYREKSWYEIETRLYESWTFYDSIDGEDVIINQENYRDYLE